MTENKPKEIRIREIVEAAVKEFLDKGFEGASMESIANQAGLTKGGLYHHFKSKDEILIAANQVYFEPIQQLTQKALKNPDPLSGLRTYIREYLQYWIDHPQDIPFWSLSMTKIMANAEYWPMIEEYTKGMIQFMAALLKAGVEQGRLRDHDIEKRAAALMAAVEGAAFYCLAGRQFAPEKTEEDFFQIFLAELLIPRKKRDES